MRFNANRNAFPCFCIILFMALLLSAGNVSSATYCSSNGNYVNYEWIQSVSVGSFTNDSGANAGYSDFTQMGPIELYPGGNTLFLTPGYSNGSYTEYWKIWIDFNGDGLFTSAEEVYSGASSGSLRGAIDIAGATRSGHTRMRISMMYGRYPNACGSFTYGEVEDYIVNMNIDDTTPPEITSTVPASDALGVDVASAISASFSESMNLSTINSDTFLVSDGMAWIDGSLSFTEQGVRFTPSEPLAYDTVYTVTISADVADPSGNSMAQDYVWSFVTTPPDAVSPQITDISPDADERDVAIFFVPTVVFSENINPATITDQTFTVSDGTQTIPGVFFVSGRSAMFNPDGNLANGTTYTVTISSEVADLAGNSMGSDFQWSFTTVEWLPDVCSSYSQNTDYMWINKVKVDNYTAITNAGSGYSDYTNTIFDLSRYFAESITLTPGYTGSNYTVYWRVFIDWDKDGSFSEDEVVLSASSNSAYTGSISVPEYAQSGNTRMRVSMKYGSYPTACESFSYGEVEDFRVQIPDVSMDTVAPSVSSVIPEDFSLNNLVDISIKATFSETLNTSTLSESTFLVSDGVSLVSGSVSYDSQNKIATFTPSADLAYATTYYVTIGGAVEDLAGNAMGDAFNWEFQTLMEPEPTYSIAGQVVSDDIGIGNITVVLSGDTVATVVTDSGGYFLFENVLSGAYSISALSAEYIFSPISVDIDTIDANIENILFVGEAIDIESEFVNGDFESGDLTGYTTYNTAGGYTLFDVEQFDINDDGATSFCARITTGKKGSNGDYEGGGLIQSFDSGAGTLNFSAEIASSSGTGTNASGGLVEVFIDDVLLDSYNFGSVAGGIPEYSTISFDNEIIEAGSHEIKIQFSRTYLTGSVHNYVDNIVLTGTSVD